jgi:hypothetical protein
MSSIAIPHANGDYAYTSFAMSEYCDDMVVQGPCSIVLSIICSPECQLWEVGGLKTEDPHRY